MILEKNKIPSHLLKYFNYKKTIVHKGYISHLADIFDEVKRVLRKDGTWFVNLGDTYYTKSGSGFEGDLISKDNSGKGINDANEIRGNGLLKDKNLCLIPFRFALEMQKRGWVVRNDIIWKKPNCMPSSTKDRFTVDFEHIFFLVRDRKYFFETQYEPLAESSFKDKRKDKGLVPHKSGKSLKQDLTGNPTYTGFNERWAKSKYAISGTCINSRGRNKRSVWTVTTKGFKGAHFATYPESLIEPMIRAGCPEFVCNKCGKPRTKIIESLSDKDYSNKSDYKRQIPVENGLTEFNRNSEKMETTTKEFKGYNDCGCNQGFSGGIILDPFFGSGTSGLVALKQNKKFVGIELNKEYIEIANNRLKPYLEQDKLTNKIEVISSKQKEDVITTI